MTDQPLRVAAERVDDRVAVLALAGELDRDSSAVLRPAAEAALASGATRLVLDLEALTFCDSSGLRLFVVLHRQAADRGGSLHLAGAQPPVTTVLRIANLHRMLPIHATVRDALG